MWDFQHGLVQDQFDITYTLPSDCARSLEAGQADIGIIPAAAYARIPNLQILPGVAIASRCAVRSILLVSRVPIDKIKSVALDTSSMTSVALTKVIFEKWLGGGRTFTPMPPNLDQMLAHHDAGLLIGDPALLVQRSHYFTVDLAEEWIRRTGKPFVFAFWAIRTDSLRSMANSQELPTTFQQSRDHGLQPESLSQICRDWAPRVGISEAEVHSYLTQNIHHQLDETCIEGLQLFYRYADEVGALPAMPELSFAGAATAANV